MLALGLGLNRWLAIAGGGIAVPPLDVLRVSPADANYRILTKQHQLWNPDTAGFHGWFPSGPAGAIQTAWGAKDATASDPDADAVDYDPDADFWFVAPLLLMWNPITAGYHAPWIDGEDGAEEIVWGLQSDAPEPLGAPGTIPRNPPLGNFRVTELNIFQLAHATSGKFHTVWAVGADGQVRESIGVGEV